MIEPIFRHSGLPWTLSPRTEIDFREPLPALVRHPHEGMPRASPSTHAPPSEGGSTTRSAPETKHSGRPPSKRASLTEQNLTRRTLYDLVWSKPMTKVAEEFQISDVVLKKIYQKHRVRTPPRGYWTKKQAGQSVTQALFHQITDPALDRVAVDSVKANLPAPVQEVLAADRGRRERSPKSTSRCRRRRRALGSPSRHCQDGEDATPGEARPRRRNGSQR